MATLIKVQVYLDTPDRIEPFVLNLDNLEYAKRHSTNRNGEYIDSVACHMNGERILIEGNIEEFIEFIKESYADVVQFPHS